jgi:type IV pilus assembly protein PilQ
MSAHNAEGWWWSAAARKGAALAVAVAVSATAGMISANGTPVRLVGISAHGNAVLIEASEPVAYSVSHPDPLTVVIDMRNVSAADARNEVQRGGAIASVDVEQVEALDGRAVARVRLMLARIAGYKVRAARNMIRVELSPEDNEPAAPAPAEVSAARESIVVEPLPDPMSSLLVAPPISRSKPAESAPATNRSSSSAQQASTPAENVPAAQPAAPASAAPAAPTTPTPAQPPVAAPSRPATAQAQPPTSPQPSPAQAAAQEPPAPRSIQAQSSVSGPQLSANTPQLGASGGQKTYVGHPISLDFTGGDLRTVLRLFAEVSGLNMIIDPDVQGSVDIVLTDVPWDQALEVILRGNQLDYTVDGTIVRIARIDTLKREQDARQALAKASADAGTLAVRTFPLSYARAAQAAPLVRKAALSPRGDVQIDERTNMLIITDLPARLETAQTLLAALDKPEPQVEIEARIVSTSRDFSRAVGIQWGLNGRVSPELGNTTGLAFPNSGSLGGRLGTQGAQGSDTRANPVDQTGTVVGLPSTLPAAAAIGLAMGSVNGAFNLDVALSALESSGKVRILSTPRVTTQNNVAAEMMQGVQIPVQTQANNTVTVTFKDAALTLRVTPQITTAQTVIMAVELENASPGEEVQGIPSINTQRARTTVQVSDGATTIIGGVLINEERQLQDRVPALHKIPLLGWLFKRDTNIDDSRELLIFITPRILKG